MGEGGAVCTNDPRLRALAESFRDWGRDCWCPPGQDNTCKNRFGWTFESLPEGYDHKYVYSHVGYNLKMTDLQAAIGVAQLKKLPWIVEKRKEHFKYLYDNLRSVESHFILPEATPESDPSWFGFPLAVKPESGLKRADVIADLEEKKIATRLLFGGNLLRQPAYRDIQYRSIGKLPRSDFVMNNVFWVGVWPGLTKEMMDYVVEVIQNIIRRR
jgi:CDP-6-deoxy-D-xylo-4-hexulose-3-dehydrase